MLKQNRKDMYEELCTLCEYMMRALTSTNNTQKMYQFTMEHITNQEEKQAIDRKIEMAFQTQKEVNQKTKFKKNIFDTLVTSQSTPPPYPDSPFSRPHPTQGAYGPLGGLRYPVQGQEGEGRRGRPDGLGPELRSH